MIYLISDKRIVLGDNWEVRHPLKTMEEFCEEFGFQIIEIDHDKTRPVAREDFIKNSLGKFVFDVQAYEKRTGIRQARAELEQIRLWFAQNDFIPHKIVTGEWSTSDERWKSYLKERAIKRARQDEVNNIIKGV